MGTIIKSYEPTFWDKLYLPALLRGLIVTFRHFFRKNVTIQYPDQKHIPPEGYRGLHRLNKFPEGRIKCVACEMCSAACPADCIHIIPGPSPWDEGKERYPVRFDIDLLRYTRDDLVIDKEGLLEVYDLTKDQNYYTKNNLSKASSVDTPIDT